MLQVREPLVQIESYLRDTYYAVVVTGQPFAVATRCCLSLVVMFFLMLRANAFKRANAAMLIYVIDLAIVVSWSSRSQEAAAGGYRCASQQQTETERQRQADRG